MLKNTIVWYSYILYYSIVVCLSMLIDWIKHPTTCVWKINRICKAPEALSDPVYGEHRYVTLKNIKMHYVEKGDNRKPLMLFIHGFPEFWYSWRHQIKEFSKDYWVVAPDLRGYGESEKPHGRKNYTLPILVEDIKDLLDSLGVNPRKKCIIVAHDWGGVIAWAFLDEYAHLVSKYVILNSTTSEHWRKLLWTDNEQFKMGWYVLFFQMPILPELYFRFRDMIVFEKYLNSKNITEEDILCYKYTFSQPGAISPPINYYRNVTSKIKKTKRALEETAPPGLYIFGENDMALSLKLMDIVAESVHNLKKVIIQGASHFVQQDAPQQVNKEIRKFLDDLFLTT